MIGGIWMFGIYGALLEAGGLRCGGRGSFANE